MTQTARPPLEELAEQRKSSTLSGARSIDRLPSRPTVIIEPGQGLFRLDLRELWEYRELLYVLVGRDIRVRYKQTAIGAAWAILQPVITMLIFVVIFGKFAKFPSDGLPYPVFTYAAILPWLFFSQALSNASQSLVGDANLLKKVYFPRLLIPLAAVIRPAVDFAISFVVLLGMMVWYGIGVTWAVLAVPFFLLLALLTALAVGLWLATINVRYRDVGHTIPFLMQIWMFASPVVYSLSLIPEKWRLIYSLNPMVGVIEGFRWALLGSARPQIAMMVVSIFVVLLILAGGLVYFRRMERTFADVV
jgi:homopolymeric O-antigen transport system permease protein